MIHCYQFNEHNIVLDVNSGAVHLVSGVAYDILNFIHASGVFPPPGETPGTTPGGDLAPEGPLAIALCAALAEKHPAGVLTEALAEIRALAEAGMLFTDDSQVTPDMLEGRGAVIKAMCLHVAHDCNMACRYCFGDTGAFSGPRGLLSRETGKKAFDFLIRQSGARRNLEIDFFGGEPLMNFGVVKELVAYGREQEKRAGKNIRFTLTTNGLLLDEEKEAFINRHMDNVILSLDGRPEVNDAMRKTVGGQSAYARTAGNLRRFQQSRQGTYYVRGTFTKYNLDFSEDVRHLAEMGFPGVSVEPVVADKTRDFALREEDVPRILEEYDKLAQLYLEYAERGQTFAFFHFNMDLSQGPCVVKRVSGCGAGTEYVAVSPEGDIYPCHQFVGEPDFKLGNVNDEGFHNALYERFNAAHIYNKPACAGCWAKFYCSGGCHANAWHENEDLLKPYALGCALEKKRVECAIGIAAHLAPPRLP